MDIPERVSVRVYTCLCTCVCVPAGGVGVPGRCDGVPPTAASPAAVPSERAAASLAAVDR